ncbi:hypothetical protein LOK49_LG09G00756 [Camellia lanceoleosa]|uniref:Uncharacterized protein n=1 Tax=Camellia lanceoleosa TaxID=1840588 RepID=A0ACC0GJU5_9ERIC|nr:hypothetical protein LOK49_LG09G00756 [Camellia lanceoleosa]
MVVRIRLSRFGCKNKPFIEVMSCQDLESPEGRQALNLEVLSYYNPLSRQDGGKRMGLNFWYWLSVGAQPSEPVERLLFRSGLLPPPPMLAMGRKGGPRDTRPIDPMTGRYLTADKPANGERPKDSEGYGDGDDEDSGTTPR